MTRGKFITFEGVDGAGKSTHVTAAANYLRQRGKEVVVTREPGGTPLGEQLRAMILSHSMHIETETLLVFAARREHIAQLIEPALSQGRWVISDRVTDATYAYQGGGRGLPKSRIAILEKWVHEELQPDLTLFFDLPVSVARARLAGHAQGLDRFEQEGGDFFERVRNIYRDRAAAEPGRIHLVDASQSPETVWASVAERLKRMDGSIR